MNSTHALIDSMSAKTAASDSAPTSVGLKKHIRIRIGVSLQLAEACVYAGAHSEIPQYLHSASTLAVLPNCIVGHAASMQSAWALSWIMQPTLQQSRSCTTFLYGACFAGDGLQDLAWLRPSA